MKNFFLFRAAFLIALPVALSLWCACATAGAYFKDRGNDFLDVFTVGVEVPVFGAQATVGPLDAGLYSPLTFGNSGLSNLFPLKDEGVGAGLRGGKAGYYSFEGHTLILGVQRELDVEKSGVDVSSRARSQMKSWQIRPFDVKSLPPYAWTRIEAAGGCCLGARLGFNPGEFVDFALGIFTVDIYGDDVHSNHEKYARSIRDVDESAMTALLEKGTWSEAADAKGRCLLHYAVFDGRIDRAEKIFRRGDVLRYDSFGWTPLHYAVWNKNLEMVKLMVEDDGDCSRQSARTKGPLNGMPASSAPVEIARSIGAADIAGYLDTLSALTAPCRRKRVIKAESVR